MKYLFAYIELTLSLTRCAVVYIAKVRILEQITTYTFKFYFLICCCLYSKGKNFRANHNTLKTVTTGHIAVVYIAKVRILEQITTMRFCQFKRASCCLYSKGKNFRANHNTYDIYFNDDTAVVYIAKVRILEQITTVWKIYFSTLWLLFI